MPSLQSAVERNPETIRPQTSRAELRMAAIGFAMKLREETRAVDVVAEAKIIESYLSGQEDT